MRIDDDEIEEGEISQERWIVSYADFVTTLFALFVLLFALSFSDARRGGNSLRVGYTSVAKSIGAIHPDAGLRPGMAPSGTADRIAAGNIGSHDAYGELRALQGEISEALRAFSDSGVSLKVTDEGLVISLAAARFFNSGDDTIRPDQITILDRIAVRIGALPNQMRIEGFTDSLPIRSSRFKDNWDLSAARAGNVLRYLIAHSMSLNPRQLSLAGYGPYRPVAGNDTEEGRALNRRVDIVIRPWFGSTEKRDATIHAPDGRDR
jgi:chemotaxis protein MotB